jgi:hypothetical protein
MTILAQRLELLQKRIEKASGLYNRPLKDIRLIAVSKRQPAQSVAEAGGLGLTDFGENYLQEGTEKISSLCDKPFIWHFIGNIQSNKTKVIAENFDWIHTVDRLKIAQRLSSQCPQNKHLNILLQVNIDQDTNKGGLTAADCPMLVEKISSLPNLRLRGLMAILSQNTNPRVGYETVAQLHRKIKNAQPPSQAKIWDTLSMGMTNDLEQAIQAGATMIRVGTALFGPRE